MEEIGKVIEIIGDSLKIEITPSGGCSQCSQVNVCNPFGQNKKVIELENTINAQVGDSIRLEIKEKNRILSLALLFGLPTVLFVVGVIIGQIVGGDKISAILGGVGLLLAFLILIIINRYLIKKGKNLVCIKEKIINI
jgi:sigma-E factor negative regulatory protein RseC